MSSSFLFEQLPIDVTGAEHSNISLLSILKSALGPDLGGYAGFWIADASSGWLADDDFNYWNPAAPDPSSFTVNGIGIPQSTATNFKQTYVTAAQLSSCKLVIGNEIAPLNFVTMDITNGSSSKKEYIQYELNVVDPSLQRTTAIGTPTSSDIVAAAQRFASVYSGILNDNDCHFIAGDVAAAAGATLDNEKTGSLDPSQNESSGFWRVVYRGSDPNPVTNWQTLVRPGDIVRMGWIGGGQHTTTVLGVNTDGSINVFDNADSNSLGQEDIGIHTANYDLATIPTTVTIFRLTTDGYYLINSDNNDEILNGSQFNNEFDCGSGNDIVNCGPGHDLVNVGVGAKTVNGGGGFDTVSIPVSFAAASVTDTLGNRLNVIDGYTIDSSGAAIRISWSNGEDTLNGVSALQFSDRLLAVDAPVTGSILFQGASGQAALWGLDGTHVIAGGVVSPNPGPSWKEIGTGDFNDDGLPDLLWQNANGQAAIWDMNGTTPIGGGAVTPQSRGELESGRNRRLQRRRPFRHPVAERQRSGRGLGHERRHPDRRRGGDAQSRAELESDRNRRLQRRRPFRHPVAERKWASGDLGNERDQHRRRRIVSANPGSSWQVIGTGDFNSDGHSDILWQNTNGQVAIWEMNGDHIDGGGVVSANPGPSWHVIGTGGEGSSDILFQNTNGQTAIWDMNGTNIVSGGAVGPNPGPSWKAVGLA